MPQNCPVFIPCGIPSFVPSRHLPRYVPHLCPVSIPRGIPTFVSSRMEGESPSWQSITPPPPGERLYVLMHPKLASFPPYPPLAKFSSSPPPPLRGVKTHSSPRWPHIPLPLAADPKPTYGRRDGFGPGFCGLGLSAGWRCADSGRCGPEKCGLTFGLLRAKFHVKNKNQTCKNTLLLLPIFQKIKNFDPIHSCFCKKN